MTLSTKIEVFLRILHLLAVGLHTCTAVACSLCVSWAFLLIHSVVGLTDRVCEGAIATSEVQADFSVSGNVDVTVRTVIVVTDALQEVPTGRHLVRRNTMGERTISDFARATKKPTCNNKANQMCLKRPY